jgi:uncharacterized protein DUF885
MARRWTRSILAPALLLVPALALGAPAAHAAATAAAPAAKAAPPVPTWVARSNEDSQLLLDVFGRLAPEQAGAMGVDGLDKDVTRLPLDFEEQSNKAIAAAEAKLKERLATEQDPAVRQDLQILIDAADQTIQDNQLSRQYMLPYVDAPAAIFQGIRALLDDQVPAARRADAVVRMRRYAGMEPGYTPFTEQAKALLRSRMSDPKLVAPFVDNLERDLGNGERYAAGIAELCKKFELAGWEEPYETLQKQLADYEGFIRTELMPRAAKDFRLPPAMYAQQLKDRGIDMPVDELVSRAKTSFREIQNEMQAIAPLVAKQNGFASTDYRDVIRELKKKQLQGDAILPHYQHRIADLEKLIVANKVLTLPERPMRIRLASEAESAAIPAPNMHPPRLIGNTGEQGEFVLPLRIPAVKGADGKVADDTGFDDFTFEAASWTLTAHEGRPGHELQFSSIVEKGVSQARILFAFNSVNVEGWGLYAEAEMKPYEPLDGQLIALQHRLLRAARAFLDPGLQLGTITREEAYHVLEDEVVDSHAMATQEVQRYTFLAPGQAPSYFVGYSRLMELRTDVERNLGDKFDRASYHDFVLAQGLLPPALLRKAVMEQYVAPRMEKPAPATVSSPAMKQ